MSPVVRLELLETLTKVRLSEAARADKWGHYSSFDSDVLVASSWSGAQAEMLARRAKGLRIENDSVDVAGYNATHSPSMASGGIKIDAKLYLVQRQAPCAS